VPRPDRTASPSGGHEDQDLEGVVQLDGLELGISDLSTTLGIYGHRDDSDLETAMEAYAQWLEDEAPSVPSEEGS
jgi:hypothetical protein